MEGSPADAADPQPSFGDILRINDMFHESARLHHALAAGVFDLLAKPRTCDDVAAATGWVGRKCRIYLDALVASGLLVRDGDRYANSSGADRFLVSTSADSVGGIVHHQRLQWELWGRMDEVLTAEQPTAAQQERRLERDPAANDAFNTAMVRLARDNVAGVVAIDDFAKTGRVLDLCGGHGTYLAALAAANPELHGEVWDLEPTRAAAEATFATYGVSDRLGFRAVDMRDREPFATARADACMLNDCLHYFGADEVHDLIGRAAGMLEPGGLLLVSTMRMDDDRLGPGTAANFSFHMMLNTGAGELHPTSFLAGSMRDAGLDVEERIIGSLGRVAMLLGRRP